MKVALDEHIPYAIVCLFKTLATEGFVRGELEFASARDYHAQHDPRNDDRPWLQRFKDDGGKVVISGDRKMRGRIHEREALRQAGFIVLFLGPAWEELDKYSRAAVLIRWWPKIEPIIFLETGGRFWEIPCTWRLTELVDVTPPAP